MHNILYIALNLQTKLEVSMKQIVSLVLRVNTVSSTDWPHPQGTVTKASIAPVVRIHHSPQPTLAAPDISVRQEVGMRLDVPRERTSPTGNNTRVKYVWQAPTARLSVIVSSF